MVGARLREGWYLAYQIPIYFDGVIVSPYPIHGDDLQDAVGQFFNLDQ